MNLDVSCQAAKPLAVLLEHLSYDRLFILADECTAACCLPRLASVQPLHNAIRLTVPAGESHKNIVTATQLWKDLYRHEATRHSLLLNIGGGMISDLGGFVAATFKRGMPYINIPTTLLAAVDASVGGKTGVNFAGCKNGIGAFHAPLHVIVATEFFETLGGHERLSGYAEMLKHALLSSMEDWREILDFDLELSDQTRICSILRKNIAVKHRIVRQDPTEQGARKALNLGHTLGHAIESRLQAKGCPVPHGYAVLWGLVGELFLSHIRLGFPKEVLQQLVNCMKRLYGSAPITCNDYEPLYAFMKQDKKNRTAQSVDFTLLAAPGDIHTGQTATKEEIEEALDFLQTC